MHFFFSGYLFSTVCQAAIHFLL